jgi:RNA polymerase sigma-70 factor (ECF subfamily)
LPPQARGLADTDDLVQVTLVKALGKIETFEPRREGAFLAYLRQILINQLRDLLRKSARRPQAEALPENLAQSGPSPLEAAIGSERLEKYERALASLSEKQREAVILRLEMGFTHAEVAEAIGSPSWNAARMMVVRALVRLAEVMDEDS